MKIEKDSRIWKVNITMLSTNCIHLRYPANYHGCKLLEEDFISAERDDDNCTLENCQHCQIHTNIRKSDDVNRGFLHSHPIMENQLGVDENHIIVDKEEWEEIRRELKRQYHNIIE